MDGTYIKVRLRRTFFLPFATRTTRANGAGASLDALEDLIPPFRVDHPGYLPRGEGESSVAERLGHSSPRHDAEVPTLRRTRVIGVLTSQRGEVGARRLDLLLDLFSQMVLSVLRRRSRVRT